MSGEHVIAEWILQYTIMERFYAGLTRKLPISLPGASIAHGSWQAQERMTTLDLTCSVRSDFSLFGPNETELSHRWLVRALLSLHPS